MELCIAFFPHTWEEQASHRTKQSPMNLEGEKKKNNAVFYEDIYFKGIYSSDKLKQTPNTPRQGLMKNTEKLTP